MARKASQQACTQFYLQTILKIDLQPPSALPLTDRPERRESRHSKHTTHRRVTKRLPDSEFLRVFQFLPKLREKSEWVVLLTWLTRERCRRRSSCPFRASPRQPHFSAFLRAATAQAGKERLKRWETDGLEDLAANLYEKGGGHTGVEDRTWNSFWHIE